MKTKVVINTDIETWDKFCKFRENEKMIAETIKHQAEEISRCYEVIDNYKSALRNIFYSTSEITEELLKVDV